MSNIAQSMFMQTIWASDELMAKMGPSSFLDRRLAMIEEKREKENRKLVLIKESMKKLLNTKLDPGKLVAKL